MGKEAKRAIHWRTPKWIINSTCFALGVFYTQWISLVYDTRLSIPWKLFSAIYRGYVTPCITVVGPHLVYHFHTQLPTTAIGTHAFRVPLPSSVRSLGFSIHQMAKVLQKSLKQSHKISVSYIYLRLYTITLDQIKVNIYHNLILWEWDFKCRNLIGSDAVHQEIILERRGFNCLCLNKELVTSIYLESKWPLFWLKVGPSFGGKTRDKWVPGIEILQKLKKMWFPFPCPVHTY